MRSTIRRSELEKPARGALWARGAWWWRTVVKPIVLVVLVLVGVKAAIEVSYLAWKNNMARWQREGLHAGEVRIFPPPAAGAVGSGGAKKR